jgi:hypothetical protein
VAIRKAAFREGEAPAEPRFFEKSRLGGSLALPFRIASKRQERIGGIDVPFPPQASAVIRCNQLQFVFPPRLFPWQRVFLTASRRDYFGRPKRTRGESTVLLLQCHKSGRNRTLAGISSGMEIFRGNQV